MLSLTSQRSRSVSHKRFDELKERLLRAGIAPRHVRRYIRELRDHFDDLVREEMDTGATRRAAEAAARARIGSDDELSGVMLTRPELRSMTARFPWATFGFGPVLMLTILIVAAVLLEGGFLYSHRAFVSWRGEVPVTPPGWVQVSMATWNWLIMYAAPLMLAILLCLLGIRQRSPRHWIMLAVGVVCILGAFHEVEMTWSDLPGRSSLGVGFALVPPFPRHMIIAGLFRAAINLALAGVGYWTWRRTTSERNAIALE